ncbi:MAG: hypothetical protein H6677_02430 [Candidatus Obscuribacterales bacterium]|nr:hypothetical protein [Cyanobacteria bacterium HKST-UBA01]MCB9467104.1 hypothetical protein [Candidatus Obscuribacterales bacterium]
MSRKSPRVLSCFASDQEWLQEYSDLGACRSHCLDLETELKRELSELERTETLPRGQRKGSDYARQLSDLQWNIALCRLEIIHSLSELKLLIDGLQTRLDSFGDVDLDDDFLTTPEFDELVLLNNLSASCLLLKESRTLFQRLSAWNSIDLKALDESILAGRFKREIRTVLDPAARKQKNLHP